jgi:hypothetical protein
MKHKYILLIIPVLLLCLQACKLDPVKPVAVTVVGKWYLAKHNLKLIIDGVQVGETIRTSYNKDDFAQFFQDGTGLQSKQGSPAASLSTFHYTLNANVITLFTNASSNGQDETIITLTATELVVHYESQIPNQTIEGKFNTEIDDYAFKK